MAKPSKDELEAARRVLWTRSSASPRGESEQGPQSTAKGSGCPKTRSTEDVRPVTFRRARAYACRSLLSVSSVPKGSSPCHADRRRVVAHRFARAGRRGRSVVVDVARRGDGSEIPPRHGPRSLHFQAEIVGLPPKSVQPSGA